MTRTPILAGTSALALVALAATPAYAAGTAAGTQITNSAEITYQVNSFAQTALANSGTVTVDRVINLTVGEVDPATTLVTPGQTRAVVTFGLMNTSNATLDFLPTVVLPTGGAAAHGGTDSFNVSNGGFFADTNANGTFDSGTDTALTFFDELPADTSRIFSYVADIPTGLNNGQVASIVATAAAREGGTADSLGAALTQTTGANTPGIDTVFADTAGATDAARDAVFSARDDFTVSTATLTPLRTSTVISDPVNGTNNPKVIPGALVEYCIAVSNAAGAPSATSVTVVETLGANQTYDTGFGVYQNGTATGGICATTGAGAGTTGGTFASGKVTGTIGTIAAGETKTIRYRATVN